MKYKNSYKPFVIIQKVSSMKFLIVTPLVALNFWEWEGHLFLVYPT